MTAEGRGRIVIGANDPSLTRVCEAGGDREAGPDASAAWSYRHESSVERRWRPVRVRRGVSPGQLVVSMAESQMEGGESVGDLRRGLFR